MSIQSLITPAMFIVSALVLPISRNTACEQRCNGRGSNSAHSAAAILVFLHHAEVAGREGIHCADMGR
jgi:hypothetical protein